MAKVLFTGWEGSILNAASGQVFTADELQLVQDVVPALLRFSAAGYRIIPSTNRPGLAEDDKAAAAHVDTLVIELLRSQGIPVDDLRICADAPNSDSSRRKPSVGLFTDVIPTLDRSASYVVDADDSGKDLALNLGVSYQALVPNEPDAGWLAVSHTLLDAPRRADVHRKTKETDIRVLIDLDATADPTAKTGLPFFDHMLEQLGKHGGFRLAVRCDGDLQIDEHHTIEDVALATGSALREALGDKRGIERYGFVLPMDETRAEVSVDLGGRPYLVFTADFPREEVGGMPTELVEHFFRSFSDALGASLHVSVTGENTHHMIEASFKGLARALRMAIRRSGDSLPSTKGVL